MQIYYDNFTCDKDVFEEYGTPFEERKDIEIIYASYEYRDYEGYSFVLFIRDGKLYEVNGSHCSCNGLEGCWEPEENDVVALLSRPNVPDDAKNNLREIYQNLITFC